MVDRDRRGRRPLAGTEIIEEAAEGSQPDVEVLDMGDLGARPYSQATGQATGQATAAHKKGKWLDEVRTKIWDGRDPPPGMERRSPRFPSAFQ